GGGAGGGDAGRGRRPETATSGWAAGPCRAAGGALPPSKPPTGPAPPRRPVCAPGPMPVSIYRRPPPQRRPIMWFLSPRNGRSARTARRPSAPRSRPPGVRPRLATLGDRSLPSTFTVLNLSDQGAGSLRAAITAANANPGADIIDFQSGLSGTIALGRGELFITDSLSVQGPGVGPLTISGSGASRVVDIG